MEPSVVSELIKNAPIAGALITMCIVFLKYLTKRDESFQETYKETAREISDKFSQVVERNNEVIENSSAIFRSVADRCFDIQVGRDRDKTRHGD